MYINLLIVNSETNISNITLENPGVIVVLLESYINVYNLMLFKNSSR